MHERPRDRFIIAASPAYLQAVEEELCADREELASTALLTIVSSKGYRGSLRESVTLTSAAMMKTMNTNMTCLNTSYAVKLLHLQSNKIVRSYKQDGGNINEC